MFKSCPFTNYHCRPTRLFGNVSELWLLTLPWFSNLTLEETMSTVSSVALLVAHINSVAAQLATSRIGSSFGCIIFLAASVPGQPHDQIFQRVSTISSREVTWHCITKTYQQQRWALADWFGHLQSCTVLEGFFCLAQPSHVLICWKVPEFFIDWLKLLLQCLCIRQLHLWVRISEVSSCLEFHKKPFQYDIGCKSSKTTRYQKT